MAILDRASAELVISASRIRASIARRGRQLDERGLEGIVTLAIILGAAVLIGIAVLIALRGSIWNVTDDTTNQIDNSVGDFSGGNVGP